MVEVILSDAKRFAAFAPYEFALAQAKAAAEARLLRAIAEETNLGYSWLEKFARGKIPNAGHERLSRLVRHFRDNPRALPEREYRLLLRRAVGP